MSGSYKLVIHNGKKIILQEELSQFKFKDLTDFTSDMFKLTTNLLQATVLSVGAQLEYSFISRNIKTFADLKSVNEKFQKKLETAEKIYQDAIPESVRKDVNLLFNMTNPGYFIGKKLIDTVSDTETLDTYIPFWWFTKYVASQKFFETDVKDFGQIFGFKFNNLIWYRTWLYRDIVLNNYDIVKKAIDNGVLSRSGIDELKNIHNMQDLINSYPKLTLFVKAFDVLRLLMRPIDQITSFANNWNESRYASYAALQFFLANKKTAYEAAKAKNPANRTQDENNLITEYESKKQEFEDSTRDLTRNLTNTTVGLWSDLSNLLPNLITVVTGESFLRSLMNFTTQSASLCWNLLKALVRQIPYIGALIPADTTPLPPISLTNSYVLQIKNNQKFLTETEIDANTDKVKSDKKGNNVSQTNNLILNDKKVERLKTANPNDAELIIIEKLMSNKKLKKYTEQWLELVKLTKTVATKDAKAQGELFLEMLKFSGDFFGKIQGDLNQSLQDLNNEQTDISKDVNKELKNKFQFEMTPQGFAAKLSQDFEILCTLTRTTANTYLTDIEFTLKQFDVIFEFLKTSDVDKATLLTNDLKNQINKKLNFILNDKDINKKFEEIDKSIIKIFDKDSRTYEDFKKSQTDLFNNLKSTKENIEKILENFLKGVSEFKNLNKFDKLNSLIFLIDDFIQKTNNTINQIYQVFLPKLIGLKNIFEKDLNQRRFELKKDFEELLKKMDQKSFDVIYSENKGKLDVILTEIFKMLGQNKESGPLIKKIEELEQNKKKYKQELENEKKNQQQIKDKATQEIENQEDGEDTEKEEKASLKINKDMKTLNPINIQNDDEE
jgi:hypothetical protein